MSHSEEGERDEGGLRGRTTDGWREGVCACELACPLCVNTKNAGINGLLCTLLRNTLLLRTWEHVRVHVVTHCCLRVLLGRLPLWAFAYQICMAEYESASL